MGDVSESGTFYRPNRTTVSTYILAMFAVLGPGFVLSSEYVKKICQSYQLTLFTYLLTYCSSILCNIPYVKCAKVSLQVFADALQLQLELDIMRATENAAPSKFGKCDGRLQPLTSEQPLYHCLYQTPTRCRRAIPTTLMSLL